MTRTHGWVRVKTRLRQRPWVLSVAEAAELTLQAAEAYVSPTVWQTPEDAEAGDRSSACYRPILDLDGSGSRAEEQAADEAYALLLQLRRDYRIEPRDWAVCLSGRRGVKLVSRHLLPADQDWGRAWRHWAEQQDYATLDPGICTVDTARWVGARHPATGRYQAPVDLLEPESWGLRTARRPDPSTLARHVPHAQVTTHLGITRWAYDVMTSWRVQQLVEARPRRRRRSSVDYWAALSDAGHTLRARPGAAGWRRLDQCPYCDGRQRAVVWASGVLHCLSTRCPASAGISPGQWSRQLGIRLQGTRRRHAAYHLRPPTEWLELDDVRQRLPEVVEEGLRADHPVVLAVTPGVGKSRAAADVLADAGLRSAYATPTRQVAQEIERRASRQWLLDVRRLEPRSDQTCYYPARVDAASSRGYSPGHAVCARCDARDSCEYYRRRHLARETGIVIGPWESVADLVGQGSLGERDWLVVDELPLRYLLPAWTVGHEGLGAWAGQGDYPAIASACSALAQLLDQVGRSSDRSRYPRSIDGQSLAQLLELAGPSDLTDALAEVYAHEPAAGWASRLAPSRIAREPPRQVLTLIQELSALLDHGGERCVGVQLMIPPSGACVWQVCRPRTWRRAPDLYLDAYADPEIYDRIAPGSEVVRLQVRSQGAYYWAPTRSSRASWRRHEASVWRQGERIMEHLTERGYGDLPLILTHSTRAAAAQDRWPRARVTHYYAGRGTNEHAGCSAVIALGTPYAPPHQIRLYAQALCRDEEALAPDDERLEAIRRIYTEQEIAQGVHRVRPVSRPVPCVLVTDCDVRYLPRPTRV